MLLLSVGYGQDKSHEISQIPGSPYLLPNGWKLSPAGREIAIGGLPLNIALIPDSHYAVIASDGFTNHFLALVDLKTEQIVSRQLIKQGWMGLAVSKDGKTIYASAGGEDRICIFNIEDGDIKPDSYISVPKGTFPTGLALSSDNHYLYAAGNHNNSFLQINLASKQVVATWKVGTTPYTCALSPDAKTAFVSNWGGNSLSVIDLTKQASVRKILVKSHPNDLLMSNDGQFLYVACGNLNVVSTIDVKKEKVIEDIDVSLYPGSPPGSTPNALALSPDGKTLYVANADNNCLAVVDVSDPYKGEPAGFIPTGWYPTAVAVIKNKIIVANGKGSRSKPSGDITRGIPGGTIHQVLEGTLSFIDSPGTRQLARYTRQVYNNTPYKNKNRTLPRQPFNIGNKCPIKYVFYIIKENRTYDQILGDMKIGNSDPYYCYFPNKVTPNHHALAETFTLFDNLYCNAEVSADGHFWSDAGYASDYVEKFWPSSYSGQGAPRMEYHDDPAAYPSSGFLWDLCAAKGITYRSYGEMARVWIPKGNEKNPSIKTLIAQHFSWSEDDYKRGMKIRPATPSLKGHYNHEYAGSDYIQGMSDTTRFAIWSKEFHQFIKKRKMPRFTVLSLPGDHLLGTRAGRQTPRAMMAENDWVLGKMIAEISHSPFWDSTAIFVIEDDPQSGPDHVDCHRTVGFVISPYIKRGFVDHTMYSTCSMIKTMEEILGLPSMTQYDESATPMWNAFTSKPDFTPYTALKNRISINTLNKKTAYGAKESMRLTLDDADTAPDNIYNQILWKAIKGRNVPYPPRKRSSFIISY
jgi:DNA-binding beta-propeller fold protein YncE